MIALALLPGLGNFLGGLLAKTFAVSARTLSLALHAAVGVVLAVVAVELLPTALAAGTPWLIAVGFVAGADFFVLVDQTPRYVSARFGGPMGDTSPWMIFGVAVDLFSDGLMIGTCFSISLSLGLMLALGQLPADLPEGFATIATFKEQGLSRPRRLLLSASFRLPITLGATVGFLAVQGQPESVKLALLCFMAGILTTVVVEEIIPSAHKNGEARSAALVFACGFGLYSLLSAYFG